MSIREDIAQRCDEGRLIGIRPLLPGPHRRALFVTPGIAADMAAAAASVTGTRGYRVGQLRRDLDRSSADQLVTVGYGKERNCFLKLLDPAEDEVWEIRSRDPKPGLRVFGRFAETDVFIATHLAWRAELQGQGSTGWAREFRHGKVMWRQLFPTYEPHKGTNINEYISRNVVEIGRLP